LNDDPTRLKIRQTLDILGTSQFNDEWRSILTMASMDKPMLDAGYRRKTGAILDQTCGDTRAPATLLRAVRS
jgi:hypothetical protein